MSTTFKPLPPLTLTYNSDGSATKNLAKQPETLNLRLQLLNKFKQADRSRPDSTLLHLVTEVESAVLEFVQ